MLGQNLFSGKVQKSSNYIRTCSICTLLVFKFLFLFGWIYKLSSCRNDLWIISCSPWHIYTDAWCGCAVHTILKLYLLMWTANTHANRKTMASRKLSSFSSLARLFWFHCFLFLFHCTHYGCHNGKFAFKFIKFIRYNGIKKIRLAITALLFVNSGCLNRINLICSKSPSQIYCLDHSLNGTANMKN